MIWTLLGGFCLAPASTHLIKNGGLGPAYSFRLSADTGAVRLNMIHIHLTTDIFAHHHPIVIECENR